MCFKKQSTGWCLHYLTLSKDGQSFYEHGDELWIP